LALFGPAGNRCLECREASRSANSAFPQVGNVTFAHACPYLRDRLAQRVFDDTHCVADCTQFFRIFDCAQVHQQGCGIRSLRVGERLFQRTKFKHSHNRMLDADDASRIQTDITRRACQRLFRSFGVAPGIEAKQGACRLGNARMLQRRNHQRRLPGKPG
jgi:hypothetical protein